MAKNKSTILLPADDVRKWLKTILGIPMKHWLKRNPELKRGWKDLLKVDAECYWVLENEGEDEGPFPGSACLASASVLVLVSDTIPLLRIVLDPDGRLGTRIHQAVANCTILEGDAAIKIEDGTIVTWQNERPWHKPGVTELEVGEAFGRYWYDQMPDGVREQYSDLCDSTTYAREEFARFFACVVFKRRDFGEVKRRARQPRLKDRVSIVENEVNLLSQQ
jgi:hypothetical protein